MDASLFHGSLVESDRIIYTPSVFAKTNLIHLQEIGRLQAKQPHISMRENLASYLFFIVLSGSGTLEYNQSPYELKKGDCVFLDCRRPYFHRSSEQLWSLTWVHFYGPNMGGIYQKYTERGGRPSFSPRSTAPYEAIITGIYEMAASSDYIRDMKIFEKLTALLSLLMEESWHPETKLCHASQKYSLQQIREYLDQHYHEKITLDQLADAFFINKYYLTRIFREQFGLTITGYILQLRITHAKQLLRFSDTSIEKIGEECGMKDANYFSRMFKKVEGISPGEYRRRW